MKKINDNTYGQVIKSLFTNDSGRHFSVAIRICREPIRTETLCGIGYRVDINNGLTPWEAIDGGAGNLATLKEAKALVADYKRRAKAQKTYQPC
jgi:hypothetical protein